MGKAILMILPCLLLAACNTNKVIGTKSQSHKLTIKANDIKASLRSGENYWHNAWTISPEINPDIWYVKPELDKSIRATFITDVDSISFDVYTGQSYDFKVILSSGEVAHTQIKGVGEQAFFSKEYQDKHRDQTVIEIPEVYELVNVVIALTSYAAEKDGELVMKDIDYVDEVKDWFQPHVNHKVVQQIDSVLYENAGMYYAYKMDAYIYEFRGDEIVSKGIYNNIANGIGVSQISLELIRMLEDFSKKSNFREFYRNHNEFYTDQINYYKDDINIAQMQSWLSKNFPATSYDCFKVIFSPLVSWNQSARWFDNYGFKEAQAHVNFPYPAPSDTSRTKTENILNDGSILFTEFNHAFINPEAEQYFSKSLFKDSFGDISLWADKGGIAEQHYRNPESIFNEMMNWSLVSLYFIDNLPRESANKLIRGNEKWQTEGRGFTHFKAFNQNLIKLYDEKSSDVRVADLYPNILEWANEFKESKGK